MSDMKIIKMQEGVILMINPPLTCKEVRGMKLINKISDSQGTSFLFPSLYGNFHCEEESISSDEVYEAYENLRKTFPHENIFVFETLEKLPEDCKPFTAYSINSLKAYALAVISAQNSVKGRELSASFENFLGSRIYLDFIEKYRFTSSELIILKGLLKYAFLSGRTLDKLIGEVSESLKMKANRKLLRKEILYVLRQRLA